ncbi:beta-carotene 15,15'-monooxygenase, partial [Bifidobacteriaceae bacterium NR003]
LRNATPMHFDSPGNYAYDFDQYAHTADALAKGQVHLNLPVPHELTTLPNPYDPMARNNLLNHSVPHMYWDYAYYKGHWYSYFGVLPAVLLFLPYRLITSIWIPGGAMLPTTVATFVFLIAFLIAGSLLVIRIIENTVKNASLGTVSISLALFFISANTVYLWFRTSFYSVPMAASLFFTSLGLWFYFGAFGNSKNNSFRNIALGSFFIALNLGCRPT